MGLSRIAVAVSLVMVPSCGSEDAGKVCPRVCESLATCHFLPSVLGASAADETGTISAQANCSDRCVRTPEEERGGIVDCHEEAFGHEGQATSDSACDNTCALFGACLQGRFPDVKITGLADVQVEAVAPPSHCKAPSEQVADLFCAAGATGSSCVWEDPPNCLAARAFVKQGAAPRFGVARDCDEALTRRTAFRGLTPGKVTAGFRILVVRQPDAAAVEPAGQGGAGPALGPHCYEFQADYQVRAGRARAPIHVLVGEEAAGGGPSYGSGTPCEVCDDLGDNDDDSFIDCEDPDCTLECDVETPAETATADNAEGERAAAGTDPMAEEPMP